jgi:hypothetical protein
MRAGRQVLVTPGGSQIRERIAPQRAAVSLALLALAVGLGVFLCVGALDRGTAAPTPRGGARAASHETLLDLPRAAQGPVDAAVGAASPAYQVQRSRDGLSAANPAQHLLTRFRRSGVSVTSGSTQVGISLRSVDYGATALPISPVAPLAHGNRVDYEHPGVAEWYANGPLGLEQGFTVARPSTGHANGPITVSMLITGDAKASLARGGASIVLSHAGKAALEYRGLLATDASGRELRSSLMLKGNELLLRVDARGARYPLHIDPFVQQGEKLTGSGGGSTGDGFGESVALSANGDTAIIGGPETRMFAGGAWIFTRSGSTWTQQGEMLTGGGRTPKTGFGYSVALSSNGNTALIGSAYLSGSAFFFVRSGSTWTQQAELEGSEEAGRSSFGEKVALSGNGKIALISDGGEDSKIGAVFVFKLAGTTWVEEARLTGGGEVGDGYFGSSVALSTNGKTALIGGDADNGGVGAAWVFTRTGSSWTQQGEKLTGSGEEGDGEFASSVALAAKGDTALIGGPEDHEGIGAAWVFTLSGSSWTQQGEKLTGGGEAEKAHFGASVALSSANGNTALIGGPRESGEDGATWAFARSGSVWAQQGEKFVGTGVERGERPKFGTGVALDANGRTALVGGPSDSLVNGAAWVFVKER